ncbi:MAG: hypothetical protein WC565_05210 [Parcubacteria group bacterium]
MNAITAEITEGQKKQFLRFVEDAAEKALRYSSGIGKDGLQTLIGNGGIFQNAIIAAVRWYSCPEYWGEKPNYRYPMGFTRKSIPEQVSTLCRIFGLAGVSYDERVAKEPLPPGAEHYFVVLPWKFIACSYHEAIQKLICIFKTERKESFGTFVTINEGSLQRSERTELSLQKIAREQSGSFLIFPAQFGIRYRNRSALSVKNKLVSDEFGLGLFETLIMLLTHPDRLDDGDGECVLDCIADEYSRENDGRFTDTPYLSVMTNHPEVDLFKSVRETICSSYWQNDNGHHHCSPTAFLMY